MNILFPCGRLLWGSLYDPKKEDFDGKPLLYKEGPRNGQPRVQFSFGIGIAKTPGGAPAITLGAALASQGHTLESLRASGWTDATLLQAGHATAIPAWAVEPWGKQIYDLAAASFRNGEILRPDFSWKIKDGDSPVPGKGFRGKAGRAPKDTEGAPGNWLLTFSSDFASKIVNETGDKELTQAGLVKCGHYVQVYGSIARNTGASPGMYLNHDTVAYRGWGKEINTGTDPRTVGFGKDALPPGASVIPQGGSVPLITGALLPPTAPGGALPFAPSAAPALPAIPSASVPSATASPSSPPYPGILTLPVPSLPPAPPTGPVMSPAATAAGYTYAALKAGGWSDAHMRQAGHLI